MVEGNPFRHVNKLNYVYILQIPYIFSSCYMSPIIYRYSLLVHHSEEELRDFGLSDDMLMDQEW